MKANIFLKLRSNISLNGDVDLAEREARSCFTNLERVTVPEQVSFHLEMPLDWVISNARNDSTIGFLVSQPNHSILWITQSLSFVQEIWITGQDPASLELPDLPFWTSQTYGNKSFVCLIPFMAAAEILSLLQKKTVSTATVRQITQYLSNQTRGDVDEMKRAVKRPLSSTPHVHGLHKYKAKFFPRLIRSLLTAASPSLPRPSGNRLVLLDPFVGSGTALIEGSILGFQCVGIDIDSLSCHISEAKIDLLSLIEPKQFKEAVSTLLEDEDSLFHSYKSERAYSFPPVISKKFERWGSNSEKEGYESEIDSWIRRIEHMPAGPSKKIAEVCLSDALVRKFNIRMMGTGVGRFALEIGTRSLTKLMEGNLLAVLQTAKVCSILRESYALRLCDVKVLNDTATKMPLSNESVSVVLTSPPYLPASSGREDYLVGKSISITALGLMSPEEIHQRETGSVGSMKSNGEFDWGDLPHEVKDLHDWLKSDPLREIKALPTAHYYRDLKKSLNEVYRVLVPKGLAIYVIGKESVFYTFSTREVLYRVACDDIFQKIAESCGFIIDDRINVELHKSNKNARPRSLDSFYETVFVIRRP